MSISLLWMLISNCSLEFLSIKDDLFTVYFFNSFGKGTGPAISASYLLAVSIICLTLPVQKSYVHKRALVCEASAFVLFFSHIVPI